MNGYHWEAFKSGRCGVDRYIITFAAVGAFIIIPYFWYKLKPFRDYTQKERKFTKKRYPDLDNPEFDLDDISVHKNFSNKYSKEINEMNLKKYTIQNKIKKLEKELYDN